LITPFDLFQFNQLAKEKKMFKRMEDDDDAQEKEGDYKSSL